MFDRSRGLRNAGWRWLAALCLIALLASACGGDDDTGDSVSPPATSTPSQASEDGQDEEPSDSQDAQSVEQEGGDEEEETPEPTAAPTTPEDPPPPAESDEIYGGTLLFALESETTAGWNPITTSAATSGHIVLRQLYDPLVIEGADGEAIPFLLESFSPNDDYTEWTFTLAPGHHVP